MHRLFIAMLVVGLATCRAEGGILPVSQERRISVIAETTFLGPFCDNEPHVPDTSLVTARDEAIDFQAFNSTLRRNSFRTDALASADAEIFSSLSSQHISLRGGIRADAGSFDECSLASSSAESTFSITFAVSRAANFSIVYTTAQIAPFELAVAEVQLLRGAEILFDSIGASEPCSEESDEINCGVILQKTADIHLPPGEYTLVGGVTGGVNPLVDFGSYAISGSYSLEFAAVVPEPSTFDLLIAALLTSGLLPLRCYRFRSGAEPETKGKPAARVIIGNF